MPSFGFCCLTPMISFLFGGNLACPEKLLFRKGSKAFQYRSNDILYIFSHKLLLILHYFSLIQYLYNVKPTDKHNHVHYHFQIILKNSKSRRFISSQQVVLSQSRALISEQNIKRWNMECPTEMMYGTSNMWSRAGPVLTVHRYLRTDFWQTTCCMLIWELSVKMLSD